MSETAIYWYVFYNTNTYEIIEFYSEGVKTPTDGILEVTVEDIKYAQLHKCTHLERDESTNTISFYRTEGAGDSEPTIPLVVFDEEDTVSPKTEEELYEDFKAERATAVNRIVVEVDGMLFDGDEESQTRMGRAIESMRAIVDENGDVIEPEVTTTAWILADNTTIKVTSIQLQRARRLSGIAQTSIWIPQEED